MKLKRLTDLFELVNTLERKTLIAVNAIDSHSLEAIAEAVKAGIVKAIVTGNSPEILKQCEIHGIDSKLFEIVHADTEEEAASIVVKLAKSTSGSILMKGLINSDKYLRAILNKEAGMLPCSSGYVRKFAGKSTPAAAKIIAYPEELALK